MVRLACGPDFGLPRRTGRTRQHAGDLHRRQWDGVSTRQGEPVRLRHPHATGRAMGRTGPRWPHHRRSGAVRGPDGDDPRRCRRGPPGGSERAGRAEHSRHLGVSRGWNGGLEPHARVFGARAPLVVALEQSDLSAAIDADSGTPVYPQLQAAALAGRRSAEVPRRRARLGRDAPGVSRHRCLSDADTPDRGQGRGRRRALFGNGGGKASRRGAVRPCRRSRLLGQPRRSARARGLARSLARRA